MAEAANTLRYRQGLVTVTNNSTKVKGVGTNWTTSGINPGATLRLDGMPYDLEVKRIVSDTEIECVKPYYGTTAAGLSYSVERNFNSTLPSKLAADLTDAVGVFNQIKHDTVLTIQGENPYQMAVRVQGFSGTEAEYLESLKGAGEYVALRDELTPYRQNNAAAHNSHYYEKNLGAALTEAQCSEIANGKFTGMYPGCYWNITYPAYSWKDEEGTTHNEASDSGTFRVGGCDTRYGSGDDTALSTHHLEIVPDTKLFDAPMNPTNTTEGAYLGSKMVTNYLRRAEALVKAAFGADHILPHREYLQNAVTDGHPSGEVWVTRLVDLMTEHMLFGSKVYGVASTGSSPIPTIDMVTIGQLPLFRHNPKMIARQTIWLRDIVDGLHFSCVLGSGRSTYKAAANAYGVRPSFLIY